MYFSCFHSSSIFFFFKFCNFAVLHLFFFIYLSKILTHMDSTVFFFSFNSAYRCELITFGADTNWIIFGLAIASIVLTVFGIIAALYGRALRTVKVLISCMLHCTFVGFTTSHKFYFLLIS